MPVNITGTRKRDTWVLSILVALGVIAGLAAGEVAVRYWLGSDTDERSSVAESPASASSAAVPSNSSAVQTEPATAPRGHTSLPPLKEPGCNSVDSPCSGKRPGLEQGPSPRKPPANSIAGSDAPTPNARDQYAPPASQQPATGSPEEARANEQRVRAAETQAAHMAALEREEIDHLTDRANSLNSRADALERQQPSLNQQLHEDLAFGQQRLQSYLNQAESALRKADVLNAQKYVNLAKAEVEKLEKLLASS